MIKNKSGILRNKWFYGIELLLDIIIISTSYLFGFKLQRSDLFVNTLPSQVILTLAYISIVSAIVIVVFKIYKCGQKAYITTVFNILLALPIIAFLSVLVDFFVKGIGIWRRTIFYTFSIQVPALFIVKFIIVKLHKVIIKPIQSIIVGKSLDDATKLMSKLLDEDNNSFDIKFLVCQNSNNLYDYLDKVKQVFLCSSCDNNKRTQIIEYCTINNIDCAVVPSFRDIIINSGRFNNANDIMLLNMVIKLDIESRFIKRAIDIIVSFISIVILSPLMIIVAILVKLQDGGKPIYSQKRLTRGNKEFIIYKFRTMIEDAEKNTGTVLATKNDNRITKLGKFLRGSRIDEIPQLFNVLKGEMSLVGPRPERPDLIQKIITDVPEFRYRTLVKAGVTGLAQTMGRYDTAFKDKLLFDLFYVNNYSLLLDLKIMFYTLHTLIKPSVTAGISDELKSIEILKQRGYKFISNSNILIVKN